MRNQNFKNVERNLVHTCDQIVEGLHDVECIQKLLQTRDLPLDQTVVKCCSLEAAKRSRKDIEGSLQINSIHSKTAYKTALVRSGGLGTCVGCRQAFHAGRRRKCPAFNWMCRTCGKMGDDPKC